MRIMKTLKRMMALFLATVLVCTAIRTTSGAGDLINLNPYRQSGQIRAILCGAGEAGSCHRAF